MTRNSNQVSTGDRIAVVSPTRQGRSLNLADMLEDGKTPQQITTLKIPMALLTFGAQDPHQIQGVGFWWNKTRPNINRDFRLVIEKIALATLN